MLCGTEGVCNVTMVVGLAKSLSLSLFLPVRPPSQECWVFLEDHSASFSPAAKILRRELRTPPPFPGPHPPSLPLSTTLLCFSLSFEG